MRSSDKKEEWSGLDGDGDGMRSERMAAKFGGSVLPGGVSRSRYCMYFNIARIWRRGPALMYF
jgi:hypothetical protein